MVMHNNVMTVNNMTNPSHNNHTKNKLKAGSASFSKLYRRIHHGLKSQLNATK